MKLAFPNYEETGKSKRVKILSVNQLEYVLKLCNKYKKSLRSVNDNLYNEGHPVNVWVDYTDFNVIKKVYPHKKQVNTDPGVTLSELNLALQPYGLYVPYVIPELFDKDRS